jgi:hypothetical protein
VDYLAALRQNVRKEVLLPLQCFAVMGWACEQGGEAAREIASFMNAFDLAATCSALITVRLCTAPAFPRVFSLTLSPSSKRTATACLDAYWRATRACAAANAPSCSVSEATA